MYICIYLYILLIIIIILLLYYTYYVRGVTTSGQCHPTACILLNGAAMVSEERYIVKSTVTPPLLRTVCNTPTSGAGHVCGVCVLETTLDVQSIKANKFYNVTIKIILFGLIIVYVFVRCFINIVRVRARFVVQRTEYNLR